HQSHNFLASRDRSQPQSATPTFEPREACASAAQAGFCAEVGGKLAVFRIAEEAPNAYPGTWNWPYLGNFGVAGGPVLWAKWRWLHAGVTTNTRLRSAGHTSFETAGVT